MSERQDRERKLLTAQAPYLVEEAMPAEKLLHQYERQGGNGGALRLLNEIVAGCRHCKHISTGEQCSMFYEPWREWAGHECRCKEVEK